MYTYALSKRLLTAKKNWLIKSTRGATVLFVVKLLQVSNFLFGFSFCSLNLGQNIDWQV